MYTINSNGKNYGEFKSHDKAEDALLAAGWAKRKWSAIWERGKNGYAQIEMVTPRLPITKLPGYKKKN